MLDRSTIRIAFRTLARHKGFTVVAILCIAISIALNTVMYSVLDAMLAPRINARQPDHIYSLDFYSNGLWGRKIHPKVFAEALAHGMGPNVEAVAGYMRAGSWRGEPLAEHGDRYKRVVPYTVTWNYFDFLGSVPLQGRFFRESDEKNESNVAVISDRLAKTLFPDVTPIGETVTLDGDGFVVIGVMERTPLFKPLDGDFWLLRQSGPFQLRPNLIRVKEVIPQKDIKAQLDLAAKRLAQLELKPTEWVAFIGKQIYKGQITVNEFYWGLVAAVAAILLVACANLANLQLARGLARTRELALRAAVGASRKQLIRLLVFESAILAVIGLAFGVLLTLWGMKIVNATMPEVVADFILKPVTSWRVFAFAAAAALVCLFIVGLVPALSVSKVDPNEMLKAGAGTGANRHHRRRYGLMIVAQVGLALPVLIGAILVLRAAWEVRRPQFIFSRYGYDARQILTGSVPLAFKQGERRLVNTRRLADDAVQRARATPGVIDAASFTFAQPENRKVSVDGLDGAIREEMAHQWSYRLVTPGYLRARGMRIAQGRDFEEGEVDGTGVILDAGSARFLFRGENPIGRAIKFGDAASKAPWRRVIGVIAEPRDKETVTRQDYTTGYRLAGVYALIEPDHRMVAAPYANLSIIARVRGSTELAAVRMQRNLRSLAGTMTPTVLPQLDRFGVTQEIAVSGFVGSLFGVFGFIGLSLVAIGMYGIVTHSVAERTREIAVRISLGATSRDILHAILREGNVLLLAGMAVGLLLAKYGVMLISMFSWGWDVYNAPLFAVIGLFLFGVATLAAYVPALRATRIDPVDALRHE